MAWALVGHDRPLPINVRKQPMSVNQSTAWLLAGVPSQNKALYHRLRFAVGDPAAIVSVRRDGQLRTTVILRDIEMQRARQHARADRVACPADYRPASGLSGDREIATAQATAELLAREQVGHVIADRSLPLIYVHELLQRGITIQCDPMLGIMERRAKDEQEIAWLAEAQAATEEAMEMACRLVAGSRAQAGGVLHHEGIPLTSERLRSMIDVFLLERGYLNPRAIVASGPQAADCHDYGSGPLRTGEPVIVDIFPMNRKTLYNGDCTRTVVHGDIPPAVEAMHAAVVAAKAAATAATRPGATGEQVHEASRQAITAHGYSMGLPRDDDPLDYCAMTHGSGHGIGLDVHEPPLLDVGGPELIVGDCLTIEPGLYSRAIGGVRVEDMVVVTAEGCRNLNRLPEGLEWR